jgi:hypothetical protein
MKIVPNIARKGENILIFSMSNLNRDPNSILFRTPDEEGNLEI